MSHLPPSGWSDVVRTSDLDARMAVIDARLDALESRIVHQVVVRMTALGGLLLLADQALSRI